MRVPFLPLERAYAEHKQQLDAEILRLANQGHYILGPSVEAFEAAFAAYVGCRYCIGVGNGFDALALTLQALGIGPGDEVIVPANTYVATWLAVMSVGAVPIPVEPEPQHFNIDPEGIAAAITRNSKAILPVHLYGHPANMPRIVELAEQHGLALLDDCAQAHGAQFSGRSVGSFGNAGCWSFYPTKNLGALGDGGAITTNDPQLAEQLRMRRNYGSAYKDHFQLSGRNSRLDELQAGVLHLRLKHLDRWNERRSQQAERYRQALNDTDLQLPSPVTNGKSVWHQFVVQHPRRDHICNELQQRGVQTMIHYPIPPHQQPAIARPDLDTVLPLTLKLHQQVFSLPIHPHLFEDEQERVISTLRSVLSEQGLA